MGFIRAIKNTVRERRGQFILLVCTAVLITLAAIIWKSPFLRILPLYVSLFVMLYQSEANRYAHLLGAANCLLYGLVYYSLGLYASVISSVLFSLPISIVTFISWNRRSYKKTVVFKKMSPKIIAFTAFCSILVWVMMFLFLDSMESDYAILDNTVFVLSTLTTVLTFFAFREYPIVGIAHIFASLLLKVQMTVTDIANIPFLIYTSYNVICHLRAFVNVRRFYKEQTDLVASKGEESE